MVLRNHGLLTVGSTIAEAFFWMYNMEAACQYQLDILSTGRELQLPSKETQDYTIEIGKKLQANRTGETHQKQWAAMLRKLERDVGLDWQN